jgi:hypothetical protein
LMARPRMNGKTDITLSSMNREAFAPGVSNCLRNGPGVDAGAVQGACWVTLGNLDALLRGEIPA